MNERHVVLITGIGGGLAQRVAAALLRLDFEVVGVDYRSVPRVLEGKVRVFQANYNKTLIEDIFRQVRPDIVLHLGRVGNLSIRPGKRFDLNVIGSRKLMDLALKYGVKRQVVLSTFHIYGAHPRNHIPIHESEPLRAGTEFPQIADAIQLDSQAVTWLYQHPEVPTVLLRPCNVVGPNVQNTISRLIRSSVVPVFMGFSPMMQFLHEQDLVTAILQAAQGTATGVYNLAGRSPIPWRKAVELTGARALSMPSSLAAVLLRLRNEFQAGFPSYLVNFFCYPCVIDDSAFRRDFGWRPSLSEAETILSAARAAPSDLS